MLGGQTEESRQLREYSGKSRRMTFVGVSLLHRDWGGHYHHAAWIARGVSPGGLGRESRTRGTGQTWS